MRTYTPSINTSTTMQCIYASRGQGLYLFRAIPHPNFTMSQNLTEDRGMQTVLEYVRSIMTTVPSSRFGTAVHEGVAMIVIQIMQCRITLNNNGADATVPAYDDQYGFFRYLCPLVKNFLQEISRVYSIYASAKPNNTDRFNVINTC